MEQNCLTVTDLVGNKNNKWSIFLKWIFGVFFFFFIMLYIFSHKYMTNLISRILLQIYSMTDKKRPFWKKDERIRKLLDKSHSNTAIILFSND